MTDEKLELLKYHLGEIEEISRAPLYNQLEVGFRHHPLNNREILERYANSCQHINQIAVILLKDLQE